MAGTGQYILFISVFSLQVAHDTIVLPRESCSCQAAHFPSRFPDADNLPPPRVLFPFPSPCAIGAKPVPTSPGSRSARCSMLVYRDVHLVR